MASERGSKGGSQGSASALSEPEEQTHAQQAERESSHDGADPPGAEGHAVETARAEPGDSAASASKTASTGKASEQASSPSWFTRTFAWFESHYGLDLRSIALFRMALGYLLLSDLAWRAIDLRAHYTDSGILTRERLVGGWGQPLFYSLHVYGGDWVSQAALFLVAAVFAFMLFVGYRTRLAAIMSWVLLCSLQGRNYIILQGGDDILRVMLFWAMFAPLGARFSVDAVLAERSFLPQDPSPPITATTRRRLPKHVLNFATMVLVMQLLTMYFVSAALKTGPTWHQQGSAIHLALHHHAFVSAIGRWVARLPTPILQGMTWQVWWLELCGPLLFFIPWGTFWWRTVQAGAFIAFHFGLFLTMELGHFPWVAMGCWLLVLPSWFWDRPLYRLTLKGDLRPKLRALSIRTQAFILRGKKWLGEPFRLPRVRPTLAATLVVLGLACYTGYGSAYAMTHGGNVNGERFHPLLMTRLYANWGMFAPNPPSTSGWFVTVATQKNGNQIDVWNDGKPVSFEEPPLPSATYKRQRWRKFGDNILSGSHAPIRNYFLRWLCLDWNEDHPEPEQIEKIVLYHMAQTANWPGKGYGPLSKNELARENCPPPPGQEKTETAKPAKPKANKSRAKPKPARPHQRPPKRNFNRPRPAQANPKRVGAHPQQTKGAPARPGPARGQAPGRPAPTSER